jgi:hypothetical protein
MRLGIATNNEAANEAQWVDFDMEGYEANLQEPLEKRIRFKIKPQTRALITHVEKRAELEKKAAGTKRARIEAEANELPDAASAADDAFSRRLAIALVEDWANVSDIQTDVALECNNTNKVWLFENINIALWVIEKAKDMASKAIVDDEENSDA